MKHLKYLEKGMNTLTLSRDKIIEGIILKKCSILEYDNSYYHLYVYMNYTFNKEHKFILK